MLVGSVLPLRQRSIGDREGKRGQAASRPVAGSGSHRCAAVKAQDTYDSHTLFLEVVNHQINMTNLLSCGPIGRRTSVETGEVNRLR
ncbi:hypothetical protein NDU88_002495 [Pleurodeles waltl]|uniref:Uncharacterized protein n=1 Tax=Pleurodeles waltl TaxID=8319 RepID=A0AAV7NE57_PLEWA|nr:hypothetical protein NDU88_002495 [Pleurodeles waltl]